MAPTFDFDVFATRADVGPYSNEQVLVSLEGIPVDNIHEMLQANLDAYDLIEMWGDNDSLLRAIGETEAIDYFGLDLAE